MKKEHEENGSTERSQYILMELLNPPEQMNYMVRPGRSEPMIVSSVSELGIFGYIIG